MVIGIVLLKLGPFAFLTVQNAIKVANLTCMPPIKLKPSSIDDSRSIIKCCLSKKDCCINQTSNNQARVAVYAWRRKKRNTSHARSDHAFDLNEHGQETCQSCLFGNGFNG